MELKLEKLRELRQFHALLIVPYGIETTCFFRLIFSFFLLIVPYGIETMYQQQHQDWKYTFNRTLWN